MAEKRAVADREEDIDAARRELDRLIASSVERERARIGHDLHDGLGQLLTAATFLLEPLRNALPAGDSGENLQQAIDLINQAIAQTSELARELSSSVPHTAGVTLRHALERLARRAQTVFGIACSVHAAAELDEPSEEQANHLYRIAQEAVTNAVKHGRATKVAIRIEARRGGVLMTVHDDGRGFETTDAASGGMGLHIMRDRARVIGAELTVRPRPEGGVAVSCFVPSNASSAEQPPDER